MNEQLSSKPNPLCTSCAQFSLIHRLWRRLASKLLRQQLCANTEWNGAVRKIKTYANLASSLSDYNNELNLQKATSQAEKKQVNGERHLKKAEKSAAEAIKPTDLLLDMIVDLAKGADHVLDLSSQWMCDFIKYYFELSLPRLPSKKKNALQNILHPLLLCGDNDELSWKQSTTCLSGLKWRPRQVPTLPSLMIILFFCVVRMMKIGWRRSAMKN